MKCFSTFQYFIYSIKKIYQKINDILWNVFKIRLFACKNGRAFWNETKLDLKFEIKHRCIKKKKIILYRDIWQLIKLIGVNMKNCRVNYINRELIILQNLHAMMIYTTSIENWSFLLLQNSMRILALWKWQVVNICGLTMLTEGIRKLILCGIFIVIILQASMDLKLHHVH